MEKNKRACPICYEEKPVHLPKLSHADWNTVKCGHCDMVYLDEAPDYASLSEDMAWTKQFKKEAKRRKQKEPFIAWLDAKTRWRLHMFRDNEWDYISAHVTNGRVLDVGCGGINNIPAKYTPFGIEIEKQAAEISHALMEKCGGFVVHAPALEGVDLFKDAFLDGIIMRSYLEHEANPRHVLRDCYSKLKPGGAIYIKVPNFDTINRKVRGVNWCGFRFPDHLNYFSIKTLRQLATLENYQFKLKNTLTRFTNDNAHCFFIKKGHD